MTLVPANGRPNLKRGPTCERSSPKRYGNGEAARNITPDTRLPASRPTASAMAPMPARARATDRTAPIQTLAWSIPSRSFSLKSRCSRAAGEATIPLTKTLRIRIRTTSVASGSPIAVVKAGAAKIAAAQNNVLPATEIVLTVGTILAGSCGPSNNCEGDAKFVEAQYGHEGDHGDGKSAEGFRAQHACEDYSYAERPEAGNDRVEQPPCESIRGTVCPTIRRGGFIVVPLPTLHFDQTKPRAPPFIPKRPLSQVPRVSGENSGPRTDVFIAARQWVLPSKSPDNAGIEA